MCAGEDHLYHKVNNLQPMYNNSNCTWGFAYHLIPKAYVSNWHALPNTHGRCVLLHNASYFVLPYHFYTIYLCIYCDNWYPPHMGHFGCWNFNFDRFEWDKKLYNLRCLDRIITSYKAFCPS